MHRVTELAEEHRSEALSLLLHSADVSNPAKPWEVHTQWTARVMEEFFKQGDREKELSLPVSPLCDRDTTNIPESQIGGLWGMFTITHTHTHTHTHSIILCMLHIYIHITYTRVQKYYTGFLSGYHFTLSHHLLCYSVHNSDKPLCAGFIQHIVRPLWDVCGDMLEVLTSSEETGPLSSLSRPWLDHLTQNWERWTQKKAQT